MNFQILSVKVSLSMLGPDTLLNTGIEGSPIGGPSSSRDVEGLRIDFELNFSSLLCPIWSLGELSLLLSLLCEGINMLPINDGL